MVRLYFKNFLQKRDNPTLGDNIDFWTLTGMIPFEGADWVDLPLKNVEHISDEPIMIFNPKHPVNICIHLDCVTLVTSDGRAGVSFDFFNSEHPLVDACMAHNLLVKGEFDYSIGKIIDQKIILKTTNISDCTLATKFLVNAKEVTSK